MDRDNLDKVEALLRSSYQQNPDKSYLNEVISNSDFSFNRVSAVYKGKNEYELRINLDPQVFIAKSKWLSDFTDIIKADIEHLSDFTLRHVEIKPDYERMNLINSNIHVVYTDWEEVNSLQNDLTSQLRRAKTDIDLNNIGNSARLLMDKVTSIIFDPDKHVCKEHDTSGSNFKNRLHCYIETELAGRDNKTLRQFAVSAITTLEKTIDLANNLTHNKSADKFIAEIVVNSTISAIAIINFVFNSDRL